MELIGAAALRRCYKRGCYWLRSGFARAPPGANRAAPNRASARTAPLRRGGAAANQSRQRVEDDHPNSWRLAEPTGSLANSGREVVIKGLAGAELGLSGGQVGERRQGRGAAGSGGAGNATRGWGWALASRG